MNLTNSKSLLLRPRTAGRTRRTQIQIPLSLFHHSFFNGVTVLIESKNGGSHRLIFAHARGRLNTVKVEIPEIKGMVNPVVKLTRDEWGTVWYTAYDSFLNTTGQQIENKLFDGIGNKTRITLHRGRAYKATWYQFA